MRVRSPALKVAAPCPLRWEEMAGDERVRFCGKCQQNVYNVESLTEAQVLALIHAREGRVCVRLAQRSDGTVITRDCWYAVRRARERLVATVAGLAVAAVGFWGSVAGLRRFMAPLPDAQPVCPAPAAEPPAPDELPDWLVPGASDEQGARPRPPKKRPTREVRLLGRLRPVPTPPDTL